MDRGKEQSDELDATPKHTHKPAYETLLLPIENRFLVNLETDLNEVNPFKGVDWRRLPFIRLDSPTEG